MLGAYFITPSLQRLKMIFFPDFIPDYGLFLTSRGVGTTCPPHSSVNIVYNIHSLDEAKKYVNAQGYFHQEPILFKKFLVDAPKLWEQILKLEGENMVSFASVTYKNFGNIWWGGIHHNQERVTMKLQEVYYSSNTSLFASFAPFLKNAQSIRLATNNFDESVDPFSLLKADTNFISQFPNDTVGTPIHAAPLAKSYSIQMIGKKFWTFIPPNQIKNFDYITPSAVLLCSGNEREYFEELKEKNLPLIYAAQDEGDLLYFPPQWGHAVITTKGINVMLNLRDVGIGLSFFSNAFMATEALLSLFYLKLQQRNQRDNFNFVEHSPAEKVYFGKRSQLTGLIPNSPCKSLWLDLLNGYI